MADRRLVVYENDATAPGGKRLHMIQPGQAGGIGIPAFRPVTAIPAVGTSAGEGIYHTPTGITYVWDGASWRMNGLSFVTLTQAAYDALAAPAPATCYLIQG